jgi:hypothetical protein
VTEGVCPQASAYGVTPGHKELFRLALRSASPLVEVCVYRGEQLWRRFRPGRRRFRVDLWATSSRDDEPLSVTATDASGGVLHSNTLRKPYNLDFCYSMCVDKQNSIIVRGGLGMAAGFDASADGGAIYPTIPPERLVPAGEDASWCPVSWFALRPDFGLDPARFRHLEGDPPYWSGWEPLMVTRRVCRLSSPDCIVWDNPTLRRFVTANARCLYFRPRLNGLSAIVVRQSVKALTDVPLSGSGLTIFRTMTNTATSPYPGFACATDGKLRTGEFPAHPPGVADAPAFDARLRRGDWLALHPSPLGTVAVYSLTAQPLRGELGTTVDALHTFVSGPSPWRNYLRLAVPLAGDHMPAGSQCDREFLFVLDASPDRGPDRLAKLRRRYGLDGGPGYAARVKQGRLVRSSFILTLRADRYLARFSLPAADLPDGLGVEVTGLNPNWDAALLDVAAGSLRRLGTVGDAAYGLLDRVPAGDVLIGNLLTCSDPDVRLQLIEDTPAQLRLIAHNPTDRTISATIAVSALVPAAERSWHTRLRPGDLQERLVRTK